jgi:hypothetical protein
MSGKGNAAYEKFDREMSEKYGHLYQRVQQPAVTMEFAPYTLCAGQVGPVPKLDNGIFACELEPGHAMPHVAIDGTWFEDHQVIPAEAVEAAAKALATDRKAEHWFSEEEWEGIIADQYKEPYRRKARAALEAAAPYMLAQAWEEGRLVGRAEEQSGFDTEMNTYGDPYMLNNEGEK